MPTDNSLQALKVEGEITSPVVTITSDKPTSRYQCHKQIIGEWQWRNSSAALKRQKYMVGFLSLSLRAETIRHAIKAVKSGERVDLERWFVKPTAASKQEIIRRDRPTKYLERESHGTSLKEYEHEQS